MTERYEYQTTLRRAVLAYATGALSGALVSVGLMAALFGPPAPGQLLSVLVASLTYWMAGLLLFNVVPWIVFHMWGLRQWWAMTGLGALSMLTLSVVVFRGGAVEGGGMILAALGALTGWIIWRVAYRRVPNTGKDT